MLNKLRRALSFSLIIISGSQLIWALLPFKHQQVVVTLSPSEMRMPADRQAKASAVLETRQVTLEWPGSMRIGDSGSIWLNFEDITGELPSPSLQTEFSDVYARNNLMAEARFEVAGLAVVPANPTRVSMPPGELVRFKWQVTAQDAGIYNGTIWLSLRFLPLDGTPASQEPIYVRKLQIHATRLIGMSGPMARLLGGAGIVLSMLIIFDDMIGLVRRWIRKKTVIINDPKDID
jgi:hypothetical protein